MTRRQMSMAGFPLLTESNFEVTSPEDPIYNCIAWAADDDEQWWWPLPAGGGGNYWPPEVPRELTLQRFEEAFALLGYVPCSDCEPEDGVEKLAIYVDGAGIPTHAARQLENGRWASKLGRFVDIEHHRPEHVGGSSYGTVGRVLERPRR